MTTMSPTADLRRAIRSAALLLTLAAPSAHAAAEREWLTRYDGPGGTNDVGLAMQLDAAGNVYVAGYSYGADGDDDLRLVKLGPDGALLWEREHDGGFGWDDARDLAVAPDGTVTVAGFTAVADPFDQDALIARWSADGTLQWLRTWSGPGRDDAKSVAVDAAGNAYVGVESDGPDLSRDYVTLKLDAAGNLEWSDRHAGASAWSESLAAIAVTADGVATVTGSARGAESFDMVTIQYDPDGTRRWLDAYNPRGNYYEAGVDVAVDGAGRAFAAGVELTESGNTSMTLIRYEASGARAWVRSFDSDLGTYDSAFAVAVGANGSVALAGCSEASTNDPDLAVVLFTAAGERLWSDLYSGPRLRGDDCAHDVAIADDGSVAAAGPSLGSGAGLAIDYVTLRWTGAGTRQWVERYDGPTGEVDEANAVAFADDGDVIVSGVSRDAGNLDIGVLRYATTGGGGGCAATVAEGGAAGGVAPALVVAILALPARRAWRRALERAV